jgi:hypothetical protein
MEIVKENYQIKEQPKLFGKWDYNEVEGHSVALDNYIAVKDTKS